MIRSEGERLVLSLTKCIDSEAFCEIKVDQIITLNSVPNIAFDRKSAIHREIPYRPKEIVNEEYSPHRSAFVPRAQESKSEYQAHFNHTPVVKHDWDTKSKSRLKPPQTVY